MSLRESLTESAVRTGSLLLVTPVVYMLVAVAAERILVAAGVTGEAAGFATLLIGLTLAIYTASTVADLELYGRAALWHGSREWIVVRHVVLGVVVLAGLVQAGWLAVRTLTRVLDGGAGAAGPDPLVGALAVLVVVAVWGSLVLFGLGVKEGYEATSR